MNEMSFFPLLTQWIQIISGRAFLFSFTGQQAHLITLKLSLEFKINIIMYIWPRPKQVKNQQHSTKWMTHLFSNMLNYRLRYMFCSSHFSFLVFAQFWWRSYENTIILHNLCLHFAQQDGQDGKNRKENQATKVTKIPKNKRRKYGMNKTINATSKIISPPCELLDTSCIFPRVWFKPFLKSPSTISHLENILLQCKELL